MLEMDPERLEEMRESFDHFDRDENGKIDRFEFQELCKAIGGGVSDEEVDIGFQAIDSNGDGLIDFNEFVRWWSNQ